MPIWSAELKELEKLYESFKGQLPELEKELVQLIETKDANVILLYSRRCLEVIITDLCECELKRDRGTEPLKGIIDKLNKEKKIPVHIVVSMQNLNTISTFGTHPKDFDPEQVKPVLNNLDIIIKWYLKYKDTQTNSKRTTIEVKDEIKVSGSTTEDTYKPKKSLVLLLSGLTLIVAVVVVAALFVLNIIGGDKKILNLEKSIAVLPFKNDSPDQERMYFINGTMEAILDNLCKIEDLRVVSRNSVEQYRDNPKPTPMVAKEMDVSYVLEGSGHRDGDNVRLIVQLLDGRKDKHLWSKTYDANIEEIFSLQSEIAQLVASEINVIITPQEQQLIEKIPTANLTAYDFYQMGIEEAQNGNFKRAEELFYEALDYDSTFASAYIGLAGTYSIRQNSEYFSENYLDSVLIYANIALSNDDQLYDAYSARAYYYYQTGNFNLALSDLDKAIEINPNSADAYYQKHSIYYGSDLLGDLKACKKLVELDRTPGLNDRLRNLAFSCIQAGFPNMSTYYYKEALRLDGDSSIYYNCIAEVEYWQGNLVKAIELYKKSIADSTWYRPLIYLAKSLCEIGQCEESMDYVDKYISLFKGDVHNMSSGEIHRISYIYSQNGLKEDAEYYLDQQIVICEQLINSTRPWAQKKFTYYDLAAAYAFKGKKDKAYENLRILNQIDRAPFWLNGLIKRDQLFDSIRDEPEFQQIIRKIEAKYQAEHERVRKWLEENDML